MFCFRIHATPDPTKKRDSAADGAGGAYANCWIDYADQAGAEVLARHYIAEYGWIAGATEDVRCPEREDYSRDEESLGYFEEAAKYGRCICFHVYPADNDAAI